jgi:hypothetical protein
MKTSKARHFDVPSSESGDSGEIMRERAAESCGFHQGQDLEASRQELERGGGPEKVLDRVVKRIARGEK